jgi:hypothetical protein
LEILEKPFHSLFVFVYNITVANDDDREGSLKKQVPSIVAASSQAGESLSIKPPLTDIGRRVKEKAD